MNEKLCILEGGEDCAALASGVAALSGIFFALLKISDIEEIAKIAHNNGALLSVDNTFASPYKIKSESMINNGGVLSPFNAWT